MNRLLSVMVVLVLAIGASPSTWADPLGPSSRRTSWVISEIQFHPPPRVDGRNLEFVEILNAGLIAEDLGGHRLEGELRFMFPPGTVVRPGEFLVVAPSPGDVSAAYGIQGVLGGSTNRLANSGGTVRLVNPAGAVLLEVAYHAETPWPTAAAGAGPSLVLARPSFGEGDPRAWAASAAVGGSPGRAEPEAVTSTEGVVINEVLAHTDDPLLDFVELFNRSAVAVDLSGARLTDDPGRAGFVIPAGTVLPSGAWLAYDQNQLGFALNAGGETILLYSADGSRVLDAMRFEDQANGRSWGRVPDGAEDDWHELSRPTPGTVNATNLQRDVVISEIMYHALHGPADEYVELHNRGTVEVDLGGWRLGGGIEFEFPAGTRFAPGAYLVVASDLTRLRAAHPNLSSANSFGDYTGNLSDRGERLTLTMPEWLVSTNATGGTLTNLVHVVVDEVTYVDGGAWSSWADGGGSSLELRDPWADRRQPSSWTASDESAKAPWTTLEATGLLDHGVSGIDQLQLISFGAGSYLVDDLEAREGTGAGANLLANGAFANGVAGWAMRGTLGGSRWEPTEGATAPGSLRVDAVGRGDTGANHVHAALAAGLVPGGNGTLRAKVRWLRGHPEFLIRLRGNYLEATGRLNIPENLGTPAAPNSQAVRNLGPAIHVVHHAPVLPAANQSVVITARVADPDGVGAVTLNYRVDPALDAVTIGMRDDGVDPDARAGDGVFSATLPGQAGGRLVAFQIRAEDHAGADRGGVAVGSFPAEAGGEALIRFGESVPAGSLGTYRLWMTQATFSRWSNRSKLDNAPLPVTFVYNAERVIHGVGALYAGSPHISPGYSTPSGNLCGYVLHFPDDEPLLGATEVVLDWPGRDNTAQQEPMAYWIARELGIPFNHRRFVRLHVNGTTETTRGSIYEDAQQVNSDLVASWAPDATGGDLFKIEQWFEFAESASPYSVGAPRLENYTTTGGAKKAARYRWSWMPRAVGDEGSPNDFRRLYTLVDAANSTDPEVYWRQLSALVDLEEWMRIFATENIVVNFDAWGYDIGKNMYAYKPPRGLWQLYMWDIDWVMLPSAQLGFSPTSPLMYRGAPAAGDANRDPVVGRMYQHPGMQRAYWRAIQDAVNGPLVAERLSARMDATYSALRANGVTRSAGASLAGPAAVKTWLSERRAYLVQQLSGVAATFTVVTPPATVTATNLLVLRGTAPIEVKDLRVNGRVMPVTWTTVTQWQGRWVLEAGANALVIEGVDRRGTPVAGASQAVTVNFDAIPDAPEASLVLNEIQYHPAVSEAGFVEIHNRSTDTAFDLEGWTLTGAGLSFPSGSVVPPQGYLVAAANREVLAEVHGIGVAVAAEYPGQLYDAGWTLALVRPLGDSGRGVLVDQVTYDSLPPWPAAADGTGASLQLIDPSQDNQRPANWVANASSSADVPRVLVPMNQSWRYLQNGTDPGADWKDPGFDDLSWPEGGALLYNETATLPGPKVTPLTLGPVTFYFRTAFDYDGEPQGLPLSLTTIIDDGALLYLNGEPLYNLGMPTEGPILPTTLAARNVSDAVQEGGFLVPGSALRRGRNVIAAEVHQIAIGSSDITFGLSLATVPRPNQSATPGTANSVATSLPALTDLWINELQPDNRSGPRDQAGDRDPWVELFNAGTNRVSLDAFALSDSVNNLTRWRFPAGTTLAPGGWIVVWLDGEAGEATATELHADFRLPPATGQLILSQVSAAGPLALDSVRYGLVGADRSVGLLPDGNPNQRAILGTSTPGAGNEARGAQVLVFFNEWMALNRSTLRDPADQNFDDWFELYNAGSTTVDLSGFYLSDDPTDLRKSPIPAGTTISPKGYLLVWADEDGRHNQPGSEPHVNFRLNQGGEELLLVAPDGSVLDRIRFGAQEADRSGGRLPDGGRVAVGPLTRPTPRAENGPPDPTGELIVLHAIEFGLEGEILLHWPSVIGGVYRVQTTSALGTVPWSDFTADIVALENEIGALDPEGLHTDRPARFYRVVRVR